MLLLTGQKENTGNILSSHFNVIIQSNEFEFMFCYCYFYPIKCIRLQTVIKDSNNGALLLKHCHRKIITSTPTSARMGLTSFHLCKSCKKNDRAARKHPKDVPELETCIKVNILDSDLTYQHETEETKPHLFYQQKWSSTRFIHQKHSQSCHWDL
ncbi:hypothetical protein V8G54_033559 [Vigna mungo]|uniref:Uncharacterized protein n=1 Tax=Vigna mungo TaxID=3915 RepID=A0AAQ3MNI3_VIGMU